MNKLKKDFLLILIGTALIIGSSRIYNKYRIEVNRFFAAEPTNLVLTPDATWKAYATSSYLPADSPQNAIDGSQSTRWSTGTVQVPNQAFWIDMGTPKTFNTIYLDSKNSPKAYPEAYRIYISKDGNNWGNPIVSGDGSPLSTMITFQTQTARWLKIEQTGTRNWWWAINEINIMKPVNVPFDGKFNVKSDCGAVGDGAIDDTLAIQKCIDEASMFATNNPGKQGVVFFASGTYLISPQRFIWDDTYTSDQYTDPNGTLQNTLCPFDDHFVHAQALRLPSNIALEGQDKQSSILTIIDRNGKPPKYPTYLLNAGAWNIDPLSIDMITDCKTRNIAVYKNTLWDYRPGWDKEASNITIKNLKLSGTIHSIINDGSAENAALAINHGDKILIDNVVLENWYRGLKFVRTRNVEVKNSDFNNSFYIGLAFYAPHFNDRSDRLNYRNLVHDNRFTNTLEFINNVLKNRTYYIAVGVYVNGRKTDVTNNTFLNSTIWGEGIIGVNITNNQLDGALVPIRIGYLDNGAFGDVNVINNSIRHSAMGIVLNSASGGNIIIANNKMTDFLQKNEQPALEHGAGGYGREWAGINIENSQGDSQNFIKIQNNTIEGLNPKSQLAGIRISSPPTTLDGTCYNSSILSNNISVSSNIVKFVEPLEESVGIYLENIKPPLALDNNVIIAASNRLISIKSSGLNLPKEFCSGPSSACKRRLPLDHPRNPQTTSPRQACSGAASPYDEYWGN